MWVRRRAQRALVLRRPLHAINNQHLHRTLLRIELEPELLLDRREDRRLRGVDARVRVPHESPVIFTLQPGLVDNRVAELIAENAAQIKHGRVNANHSALMSRYVRVKTRLFGRVRRHLQLGTVLCDNQRVNVALASLPMDFELESVGKHRSDERSVLILGDRCVVSYGRRDIERVAVEPAWRSRELKVLDVIAIANESSQRGIVHRHPASSNVDAGVSTMDVAADRRNLEGWLGLCCTQNGGKRSERDGEEKDSKIHV